MKNAYTLTIAVNRNAATAQTIATEFLRAVSMKDDTMTALYRETMQGAQTWISYKVTTTSDLVMLKKDLHQVRKDRKEWYDHLKKFTIEASR